MCGIAGVRDDRGFDAFTPEMLRSMVGSLQRRGPDGNGLWSDERRIAFAHTRLAILDVTGGGQPQMLPARSANPSLVLTFGGEIYNFKELRESLIGLGHKFTGTGDTEVLLHAWDEWGPEAVQYLDGQFAFAVWDRDEQTLYLVRDRLGEKPLFYHQLRDEQGAPCGVVFGSTITAVRKHPQVSGRVDATGLCEVFALAPMRTPGMTPYADIREVIPGHMLIVQTAAEARDVTYWQLRAEPHEDSPEQTVTYIRQLLERIQAQRVRSDQPVGALLSGGIDSSGVYALAQRGRRPMDTFCIEYPVGDGVHDHSSAFHHGSDEAYAQLVADKLGGRHHRVVVTLDDMVNLSRATLDAVEVPSTPHINIPMTALMKAVRDAGIPVVTSGEGADELFAGYAMHQQPQHYDAGQFPWHLMYPTPAWMLADDVYRQLRPDEYLAQRYALAREQVPVLPGESDDARRRREAAHMVMTHYLAGFLLVRADRLGLAHGVEVRPTFTDHELAQYMFNVPHRILDGGGQIPKWALRQALSDLLPETVVWRPKSGFPVAQTLRYQDVLYTECRERMFQSGPITDLLDRVQLDQLMTATKGNVSDWSCMLHIGLAVEAMRWQDRIHIG